MLKFPEIKTIGRASSEAKNKKKKKVEELFFSQQHTPDRNLLEDYENLEYPKSADENITIDFANKITDQLMKNAGVEPYNIPHKNYHIVPPEVYKKTKSTGVATTFYREQAIFFDASFVRDNPIFFASVTLHETLHLKAKYILQVEETPDGITDTPYRQGVVVQALQKDGLHGRHHQHNSGLNEAIITEIQKKYFSQILEMPEFAKEKKWFQSEQAVAIKRKIAIQEEIPEDDIIWIDKNNEKKFENYSYKNHRKVLNYVCQEIQKVFSDQFKNTDDVLILFINANFTGHLIEIGRLVEKVFGEGSFRILSNMGVKESDANLCFETLKKNRMRQIKKNN